MPEVSVVIPLYGTHQGRHSLAAVSLAWLRQDVPREVAVAGEIPAAVAPDLDADRRATVVCVAPDGRGAAQPGACGMRRGRLLYLMDADIVPLGRDYLTRGLHLARGDVLAQPWMFRLLGGIDALESSVRAEPVDTKVLASPKSCFVTAPSDGTLRPCSGERIEYASRGYGLLQTETPMVWPPCGAYNLEVPEQLRAVAPFHWEGSWSLDAL